jgi:hypothetical protein
MINIISQNITEGDGSILVSGCEQVGQETTAYNTTLIFSELDPAQLAVVTDFESLLGDNVYVDFTAGTCEMYMDRITTSPVTEDTSIEIDYSTLSQADKDKFDAFLQLAVDLKEA